ncbi:MAG: site-specific DNA-methyltransferase, partial [Nanoarchaeota archaeon]
GPWGKDSKNKDDKTKSIFGGLGGVNSKNEFFGKQSGGASRFFYTAKASKSERNDGLDNFEIPEYRWNKGGEFQQIRNTKGNRHPTVKPIYLMEYLIKLVTKENAIVLDPFAGSGSTLIACRKLNRKFIGIEKEEEYVKIAKSRIKQYLEQQKLNEF